MKRFITTVFLVSSISFHANASIPNVTVKDALLQKYMSNYENKAQLEELKKVTLLNGGKSVEALIEVMKNGKYPDKNRWLATFMLGQIMGTKSSPFIAKFLRHPSWVMRMASLKTLMALNETRFSTDYTLLLNDESMLVREQALDNIRKLKIKKAGTQVWAMLYDKKNYSTPTINGKKFQRKRNNIIKNVILTIGELNFKEAKEPLFKMIQKDKYNDIFTEIDLALTNLTGKKSPPGDYKKKRLYWQSARLDSALIE